MWYIWQIHNQDPNKKKRVKHERTWNQRGGSVSSIFINYKISKYRVSHTHSQHTLPIHTVHQRGSQGLVWYYPALPCHYGAKPVITAEPKSCLLFDFKDFSNISFMHYLLYYSSASNYRFLFGWSAVCKYSASNMISTEQPHPFYCLAPTDSNPKIINVWITRGYFCPVATGMFYSFFTNPYRYCHQVSSNRAWGSSQSGYTAQRTTRQSL